MTEINLFTFLNQIYYKSNKQPYDKKIVGGWILTQWLSHDKSLIAKVNEMNKVQFNLPDKMVYDYYMAVVPRGKRYIKWVKKRKEEKIKEEIEKLQEEYPEMSSNEARQVLAFLQNKNVKGE